MIETVTSIVMIMTLLAQCARSPRPQLEDSVVQPGHVFRACHLQQRLQSSGADHKRTVGSLPPEMQRTLSPLSTHVRCIPSAPHTACQSTVGTSPPEKHSALSSPLLAPGTAEQKGQAGGRCERGAPEGCAMDGGGAPHVPPGPCQVWQGRLAQHRTQLRRVQDTDTGQILRGMVPGGGGPLWDALGARVGQRALRTGHAELNLLQPAPQYAAAAEGCNAPLGVLHRGQYSAYVCQTAQ